MLASKLQDLLTVEPYAYQERGIGFALKNKYVCIGDEMGLGKSLQAIAVMLLTGEKTLIVCPAYLRLNWKREIEKLSKKPLNITVYDKPEDFLHPLDEDVVITSYSNLALAEFLFGWAGLVIYDEGQYLKNMDSGRSMLTHQYIYEYAPPRFLVLSGTPIENGVIEWFSLLSLLSYCTDGTNGVNVSEMYKGCPDKFARDFAFSKMKHIGKGRYVEQFTGFRNKAKLKSLLRGKYIRRLAKDELDLPKLIRTPVVVDYSDDEQLFEDWLDHQAGKERDSRAKAKSALVKAAFTVQYCKALHQGSGSPILIFTDHIESCRRIASGLDAPFIDGSVEMDTRDALVMDFQRGKIDYLVCTIRSMQAGHNLTAARDVVFNDRSWVPTKNWQAEKRIHRIGQLKKCRIHIIIGSKQDEQIIETLRPKEEVLAEAM